jgi:hypothetical protein
MSYIGNTPTQQSFVPAVDYFSGNGSTTAFTLSRPVAASGQLVAVIENVPQSPVDAFTVSGNTITFTSAPPSGSNNIYVYYTTLNTQVMQPTDGSVGLRQLNSDLQGATYGMKNRIINGAMGIWQRGTSGFTTLGNYSADRWQVTSNTSLSAVAQSSDVPSGFKYSLSVTGTNYPQAIQKVEAANCFDLVGQTVTMSFWLKQTSGAGANSIVAYLAYANATDNFSGITVISNSIITGTGSWTQYSTTFTNLPAGAANGLQLTIYANTASSATFLITGVQLEKGTTATAFDYRSYGTELALCQRYYYGWSYTLNNGLQSQLINSTGTAGSGVNIVFPQTMRSAPTCTGSFAAFASGSSAGSATFNGNYNGYSIVARAPNQYSSSLDTFAASAEL